jgi:hypothetical protein
VVAYTNSLEFDLMTTTLFRYLYRFTRETVEALFNNDGNLIGVINSGIPTMDNVGYAIKTQGLLNLMKAVSAAPVSQTRISPSEPLSAKAKKIADFIYLIEAEL